MKINGEKISGIHEEVIVFPRQSGNLVFKAKAVLDYTVFDKLKPEPKAPEQILPGGEIRFDVLHPTYLKSLDEWAIAKTSWMVIESLKATPGLEWESIVPSQPETWGNYVEELKEAGLSPYEIQKVVGCVIAACGMSQELIQKATEAFLAEAAKAQKE